MAEEQIKHLVRIANTDLDGKKSIAYILSRIKGVGVSFAMAICKAANVDSNKRVGTLNDKEIKLIEELILNPEKANLPKWLYNRRKDLETGLDKHLVGIPLQLAQDNDIKIMKIMKSYKGVRHILGLPVRGQRTRSNFRRNKGKVKLGVKAPAKKSGKT